MKNTSTTLSRIAIVSGLALGAFALSALAWDTAPAGGPPTCPTSIAGCNSPINVAANISQNAQVKQGGLWLKSLNDNGTTGTWGLIVENAPIWAQGGFVLETRTTAQGNPSTLTDGRMWLVIP